MQLLRVPAALRRFFPSAPDPTAGHFSVNQPKQVRFAEGNNTVHTYGTTSPLDYIIYPAENGFGTPACTADASVANASFGQSSTMYSTSAPKLGALRRDIGVNAPTPNIQRASSSPSQSRLARDKRNHRHGARVRSAAGNTAAYHNSTVSHPTSPYQASNHRQLSRAQREKRNDTLDRPYGFTMQPTTITFAPGMSAVQRKYKSYKGHYLRLPDIRSENDSGLSDTESDSDDGYGGGYGHCNNGNAPAKHTRRRSHAPYDRRSRGNALGLTGVPCFHQQDSEPLLKPRCGWD